jgi:hypothetical protein
MCRSLVLFGRKIVHGECQHTPKKNACSPFLSLGHFSLLMPSALTPCVGLATGSAMAARASHRLQIYAKRNHTAPMLD